MKVLVIGNGGREHALSWKLAQSPLVDRVYTAPGNAGTHREPKVENLAIDPLNFADLVDFVKREHIDFTVVGPESPLVGGIVDYFQERNLLCLGPSQFCAQLEGSKVYAKAFMQQNGIPTAHAEIFQDPIQAQQYLASATYPIVIKADGLAAGKGVIIAENRLQAEQAIDAMLLQKRFGKASAQIVIEDFIQGEEVSFIVLSDGYHFIPLATSQDHKARDDLDKGPNTGGMGAYSPAPLVTPALHDEIIKQVITPTLSGMAKLGHPFQGFLYAGLMITPKNEIKVLEFNCRFGDPETQPILMRLTSDFAQMCLAALEGKLDNYQPTWDPRPALGVVLAAHGYPEHYDKGDVIPTLNDIPPSDQYKIFHAGTLIEGGKIVTNGGRVLCVTALGDNFSDAQEKAYRLVNKVKWDGVFYRKDIGYRALK
ncbi:MAG: phosphoribosylamine--glycine ligase [Candidatus Berkiellales bacterium]